MNKQQRTPTVGKYITIVEKAVSKGTHRAYRPYWNEIDAEFGRRQLHTVTATELKVSAKVVSERGPSAGEHHVAAAR